MSILGAFADGKHSFHRFYPGKDHTNTHTHTPKIVQIFVFSKSFCIHCTNYTAMYMLSYSFPWVVLCKESNTITHKEANGAGGMKAWFLKHSECLKCSMIANRKTS